MATMKRKTTEREWEQLQAHIDGLLSRALKGDAERIEYRPKFTVQLLEMRSGRHQHSDPCVAVPTDDAARRKVEHE